MFGASHGAMMFLTEALREPPIAHFLPSSKMPKDAEFRIAKITAGLLNLQVSRIRRRWPDFGTGDLDDFSLGYMSGFVEVMTERVGIVYEEDAWRIFTSL